MDGKQQSRVSASRKSKSTVSKPKSDKPKAEVSESVKQYRNAITTVVSENFIMDHPVLNAKSVQEKISSHMYDILLHIITTNQYNKYDVQPAPFSGELYKLDRTSESKAVKSSSESASIPKAAITIKKPNAANTVPQQVQNDHSNNDDTSANTTTASTEKKPSKKNITQFNRTAKAYLHLSVARFVNEIIFLLAMRDNEDEPFLIKNVINMQNRSEISKYILNQKYKYNTVPGGGLLYNTIIPTVERLSSSTHFISVSDNIKKFLNEEIGNAFKASEYKTNNMHVTTYMTNMIYDYLSLVALTISKRLWTSPHGINKFVVETAMRTLEIGNHEWLVSENITEAFVTINDVKIINGACRGIFQVLDKYNTLINPVVPVVKKPRVNGSTQAPQVNDENKQPVVIKNDDSEQEESESASDSESHHSDDDDN